jgi:glycosyltransferase involved in cell wall biosynthesis
VPDILALIMLQPFWHGSSYTSIKPIGNQADLAGIIMRSFQANSRHLDRECSPAPVELSVIIPCYNEGEVLPLLRQRLIASLDQLGLSWEAIFVDDGSSDGTLLQLTAMHWEEPSFKVVSLSRNFGHQVAIAAGLEHASGDAVAIMDADLQDPPELLQECLEKLWSGYDVVYAVRRNRKENWAKRTAYALFYRVLELLSDVSIPLDSGDFCVMSRRVADVLRSMPERDAFLRGLRAWVGFRQTGIEYERKPRVAGRTKYSVSKLVRLAMDGIFSFSVFPLRLAIFMGLVTVSLSVFWATLHLVWRFGGFELMGHKASQLPGWTTLMCGMFFLGGVQLLILGCIGEYIGRIFREMKQRPRWITRQTLGLPRRNTDADPMRGEFLPIRHAEEPNRSQGISSVHCSITSNHGEVA